MRKIYILLALLSINPALADDIIVFQCKTTNNKIVSVRLNHDKIYCRFGKLKAIPELSFSTPKNKASTYQ